MDMSSLVVYAKKPKKGGVWDTVIIGSGPSGLTSAIYTTRGALSTLVIAGDSWGGQLMLTTDVDNFPGFAEGIQGPELMMRMRSQAERFGAEIVDKNATKIDITQKEIQVYVGEERYRARSVIIATGAETKWLGVEGEDKLRGRGISSCAPCDAPFFKDRKVAVIGGGDSAMEEALVLTKYAKSVTIYHRRGEFKASKAMQKKVFDNEKISVVWNSEVKKFIGDQKLEGLVVYDNKNDKESRVDYDGVFVAIGHTPSTEMFKGDIELDEKGYIKVFDGAKTSVKGVFVAGDVHDVIYKQAITAAGFGCMAAMEVIKYLES